MNDDITLLDMAQIVEPYELRIRTTSESMFRIDIRSGHFERSGLITYQQSRNAYLLRLLLINMKRELEASMKKRMEPLKGYEEVL